jgi:hypothetical protein
MSHDMTKNSKKYPVVCNILLFGLQPYKKHAQDSYEEMPRVYPCGLKKRCVISKREKQKFVVRK